MLYEDASTDDARLVLRVLLAAITDGGTALNYVAAAAIQRDGRVCGVRLHDAVAGTTRDIGATLVINATGAGADRLAAAPDGAPALRPFRGRDRKRVVEGKSVAVRVAIGGRRIL